MHRTLHLAVAQIHSGGTATETLRRLERQATAAATFGAELILFAEVVLHGYDYDMTPKSVRAIAESVDGPNCRQVRQLAARLGIVIMAGFFERDRRRVYNSLLIARPDGSGEAARKHNLTQGELAARIAPGPQASTVVEIKGVRCAVVICADGGIEGLEDDLRARNVDYRLCPTGGGGKMADMLHDTDLVTAAGRACYRQNRKRVFKTAAILGSKACPFSGFASANALGPIGRQTCHQGHCMIVDNQRVMRAQIPGTNVLEHMQDQMVHAQLHFNGTGQRP